MAKRKVALKFNLVSLLNRVEPDSRRRNALKKFVRRSSVKTEFGRQAIREIRKRTLDGIDKNGNTFKPYSSSYMDSDDFKIYGKSSKVNLKLTGAMQASMEVVSQSNDTVTIGITDNEEMQKALGHINGSGHLPIRDFFGLPDESQKRILEGVIREANQIIELEDVDIPSVGLTVTDDREDPSTLVSTVIASAIRGGGYGD